MLSRLLKKSSETVPTYTKRKLLGSNEKAFYGRLRRALPKCYIFPDIPLSKLMMPTRADAKARRGQDPLFGRTVDFAVFDARLNLLCVIELARPGATVDPIPNAVLIDSAGIKRFTWDADNLPSTDQTIRALAAYSTLAVPSLDVQADPNTLSEPDAHDGNLVVEEIVMSNSRTLTLQSLAEMCPNLALKTKYPHVWERVCLFCNEPRHLNQYLSSLAMQDRGVKRAGFSAEASAEISRIQVANLAYLQSAPVRASWNDVLTDR